MAFFRRSLWQSPAPWLQRARRICRRPRPWPQGQSGDWTNGITAHTALPLLLLLGDSLQLQPSWKQSFPSYQIAFESQTNKRYHFWKINQDGETMTHSPQLKRLLGVLGPLACSKAHMSGTSLRFASNWALNYKHSYFGNSASHFEKPGRTRKGSRVLGLRNLHPASLSTGSVPSTSPHPSTPTAPGLQEGDPCPVLRTALVHDPGVTTL